jgi:hypothetical protein
MADDKSAREDQARNESDRQARRAMAADLARGGEPEPALDEATLGDVDAALADVSFPATGAEVVAAVDDRAVTVDGEAVPVPELLPESDAETFAAPAAVRDRLRYPSVAAAMKRVVEAAGDHGADLRGSQREAYEKTFLALAAIDEVDDDEGVVAVADWVVERLETTGALPGSRRVRKQAATVSRASGYEVRDDEWLGA